MELTEANCVELLCLQTQRSPRQKMLTLYLSKTVHFSVKYGKGSTKPKLTFPGIETLKYNVIVVKNSGIKIFV